MTPDTVRRLRQAAHKAQEWTTERDRLVRAARADGASLREVAAAVELSHTAVAKIAARH